MMLLAACQRTVYQDSTCHRFSEGLRRPHCPRCCSVLLVAEESQFHEPGRIDHAWVCDYCGHGFVTSIRVTASSVSVAEPA